MEEKSNYNYVDEITNRCQGVNGGITICFTAKGPGEFVAVDKK